MSSSIPRGRRPGQSTTHEDIISAAKEVLAEKGFEKTTLREIARRAGVSAPLLLHQFGSREGLLSHALSAPGGIDSIIRIARRFPRSSWGRVIAEGVRRGQLRNPQAQANLQLLLTASTQSPACAEMLTQWIETTLVPAISSLGVSHPDVRARSLITVVFGSTFSNQVLPLEPLNKAATAAQVKIMARMLQVILADEIK